MNYLVSWSCHDCGRHSSTVVDKAGREKVNHHMDSWPECACGVRRQSWNSIKPISNPDTELFNCSKCGKLTDIERLVPGMCFTCGFWHEKLAPHIRDSERTVRTPDGKHYSIGDKKDRGTMRGFGGRSFYVRFNDGRLEKTNNMWHQGTIPPEFREELPSNAELIGEEAYKEATE